MSFKQLLSDLNGLKDESDAELAKAQAAAAGGDGADEDDKKIAAAAGDDDVNDQADDAGADGDETDASAFTSHFGTIQAGTLSFLQYRV